MKNLFKGFWRKPDGSWRCVAASALISHQGRIEVTEGTTFPPGTLFMNVDICKLLDEQAASGGQNRS